MSLSSVYGSNNDEDDDDDNDADVDACVVCVVFVCLECTRAPSVRCAFVCSCRHLSRSLPRKCSSCSNAAEDEEEEVSFPWM